MVTDRPILILEDDSDAVELLTRAFKKAGMKRPLRVFSSGDRAIDYLSGAAPYGDRQENPPPCLLMLDVKLPGKSGLEVLSWLKSRAQLRSIPVIMVTSSSAPADIDEALRLGIRSYCVKPQAFGDLLDLARRIRNRLDGRAEEPEDTLHSADSGRGTADL